jgi:hypothetical protein
LNDGIYDPVFDRLIAIGGPEPGGWTAQLVWGATSGVPESVTLPPALVLHAPWPNPMRGTATIAFSVAAGSHIGRLEIVDVAGRLVRVLFDSSVTGGEHKVLWDGRTDQGVQASAGTYFCRMTLDDRVTSQKLIRVL